MLTQNPVPSSEDELTVGAIREPIRYEFQSFLEDDEDDPFKILMQHQNQRQPATEDARDVPMTEDTPEPADSPMAVDVQSPIEGQEESDFDDEITGPGEVDTNGAVNGIESDVVSGYRDRSCRVVDIEVGLRWMSPALRADFDYVKVPEYVAGEEPLPQRELRNRPKVRHLRSEVFVVASVSRSTLGCGDGDGGLECNGRGGVSKWDGDSDRYRTKIQVTPSRLPSLGAVCWASPRKSDGQKAASSSLSTHSHATYFLRLLLFSHFSKTPHLPLRASRLESH